MSGLLSELGGVAANTAGETVAFAAGGAAHRTLAPLEEAITQVAWGKAPVRLTPAEYLALGVAQGKVDHDQAMGWARSQGFNQEQFAAMVNIATTAPDVGGAFNLWRRKVIEEPQFRDALHRAGLGAEWIDAYTQVKTRLLEPVVIASGMHRGLIADQGLLAVAPPSEAGRVPAYPVYPIDGLAEAAGAGYDRDRLGVLVGLQGNPMGPIEAALAHFRGAIELADFERAIAEGNTRNEWGEAIMEYARQIPTARDFVENALRGYRTLQDALAGAAMHGMTPEHATMIYQNQGRPMALTSITKAKARGGQFQPEPGEITDPYMASIVEGSLKPGYYDLAKHLIYTYPSAFFMRALLQAGEISPDEFAQYGKEQGWPPDLADRIAKVMAPTTGKVSDPHVGKAQTQLWNQTHTSYVKALVTEAEARSALAAIGLDDAAQGDVIALWNHERELGRLALTPSQIKKAIGEPGRDAAWAKARLIALGMNPPDADAFLAE